MEREPLSQSVHVVDNQTNWSCSDEQQIRKINSPEGIL